MKTVFNVNNVDAKTQPMFLGEPLGTQRYDNPKYPIFKELDSKQMTQFWRPEEMSLQKDRHDFKTLAPHEQFIFTTNLQYQTMMDSVICRGVPTLLEFVSNTELEACLITWQFFEKIHSQSYSYIIQNLYPNSTEIFDGIYNNKEIMKRARSAIYYYDNLMNIEFEDSIEGVKDQIYLTLISINALESIRFYVSFIISFVFGENKKMVGNADIIKLIKRDEALHLAITQNIIDIMYNDKSEGFQESLKRQEENAIKLLEETVKEEQEWVSYLLKDGAMPGISEKTMHRYIEWLSHNRRKMLHLPYDKSLAKSNPLKWTKHWIESEAVQVAPQEHEITSYKISASRNDLDNISFGSIESI